VLELKYPATKSQVDFHFKRAFIDDYQIYMMKDAKSETTLTSFPDGLCVPMILGENYSNQVVVAELMKRAHMDHYVYAVKARGTEFPALKLYFQKVGDAYKLRLPGAFDFALTVVLGSYEEGGPVYICRCGDYNAQKFVINGNGTISPMECKDLVLGIIERCGQQEVCLVKADSEDKCVFMGVQPADAN